METVIDEHQNSPEEPVIQPSPTKKKLPVKKIILGILIITGIYLIYSLVSLFISPDNHVQQIYLVPRDAAFIIHSSEPVKDWKKFSQSEPWQELKKAKSLAEITENVEALDSIIHTNKFLLSLVGKRDMMISIHKTRTTGWDALIILDMQRASKMEALKQQMETLLKLTGSTVTNRGYKGYTILEMKDPDTRDILYTSFVDNHLVSSYTARLVEAAIDEKENPRIGLNHAFIEAEKLTGGKGLYRVYVNYDVLPDFMSIYLGGRNEYIDQFSNSMDFAGLHLQIEKNKMEMKGHTLRKDIADPYVTALLNSGKHKMKAHEIMPARTALYTNIGIEDPRKFVKELESILEKDNPEMYKSYAASRKRIESLFGISMDEHFLSWMSGEFAISQSEPGLLGRDPEYILAIRAKNIKDARNRMEFIEKKIKNRTPVTVKKVTYKGYDINYVEMRGFFRLFFGGLFDRFEKPYYTYVDDYVVFSNKSSGILTFLEDYEQKQTLKNDNGFKKAFSHFNSSSTLFLYADMHKFYPLMQGLVNPATWNELQANKDILYAFPYWTTQIEGNQQIAAVHYRMDYKPYTPDVKAEVSFETDPDAEDKALKEDAASEKELMNELKRFYVEKFEGNVLREFYPEGAILSETEIREGLRHGRHREYYENGKLKRRGKYVKNRPKGTWKYYTPEGKFDRKEKY